MKLTGEQRDVLASFVLTQNAAGAIAFVESLVAEVPAAQEPAQDVRGKKKASD